VIILLQVICCTFTEVSLIELLQSTRVTGSIVLEFLVCDYGGDDDVDDDDPARIRVPTSI